MRVNLDLLKTNPNNDIADELHSNVGASAFNLYHDFFYGGLDLEIWTAPGQTGTQLTDGVDYNLSDTNDDLSDRAGVTIYGSVTIDNVTYQTGDLYFTYHACADYVDAADIVDLENLSGDITFRDQYQTSTVSFSETNADGLSLNFAYDSQSDFDWTVRLVNNPASLMAAINSNRDDLYEYVELLTTQGAAVGVAAGANLLGVDGIAGITPTGKSLGDNSNLQEMLEGIATLATVVTDLDVAYNEGSSIDVDTTDVVWTLGTSRAFQISDSSDTNKFKVTQGTAIDSVKIDTSGGFAVTTDNRILLYDAYTGSGTGQGVAIYSVNSGSGTGGNITLQAYKTSGTSGNIVINSQANITLKDQYQTAAIALSETNADGLSSNFPYNVQTDFDWTIRSVNSPATLMAAINVNRDDLYEYVELVRTQGAIVGVAAGANLVGTAGISNITPTGKSAGDDANLQEMLEGLAGMLSVDSADLTLETTTSGDIVFDSVDDITFSDQYQTTAVEFSQTNADGFDAAFAYDSQSDFDWSVRGTGTASITSIIGAINANRGDLYEYVELLRTQGAGVGVAAGANLIGTDGITGITPTGGSSGDDANLQEMLEGLAGMLSVDSANLTLETTTSGDIYIDSAGALALDSAGALALDSAAALTLKDQYLTSAIPLSESGETGLDTTATSIVGAINELLSSVTGASYTLTYDDWTAIASPVQNSWYAVTYGDGVFVAVGYSGTNRAMRSVDGGLTWEDRSVPEGNTWLSVAYGNGTFVAVATDGTNRVMRSTDNGYSWSSASAAAADSWSDVTYGNGTFVAVSYDGTVMYSTNNGSSWSSATTVPEANSWEQVAYGNGVFVAVSSDGTNRTMYSTDDGDTWTAVASSATESWYSVAYGDGVFVAVAAGTDTIMWSDDDGQSWNSETASSSANWNSVIYGYDSFVAVNTSGGAMRSTDKGQTWSDESPAESNSWKGVAFGGGVFVAITDSATTNQITRTATTKSIDTLETEFAINVGSLNVSSTNFIVNSTGALNTNSSTIELQTDSTSRVTISSVGDTVFYGTASTTGALPVITLDQADTDEPFLKFIGDAASADLTRDLVDTGDVTTPTVVGYLKIEILDDGDQITDGDYFIPFYSLA